MIDSSKSISELFENIQYNIIVQAGTDYINTISTDSRLITDGNMYIALKGDNYDGHDFIKEAYHNGAKYIVINHKMLEFLDVKNYEGTTIICLEDTRLDLPYIINNLYSQPSRQFKLIGVTGTNGKTSVTTITQYVLMNMKYKTGLIGTIHNTIDHKTLDIKTTTTTTPDCVELGKIMNEFVRNKVDITLMEVSSMALKKHRVDGYEFDIAVFTNLSPEHLDNHKTMQDYLNSKLLLFDKALKAVINVDDDYSDEVLKRCLGKIIRYGIRNTTNCDIYAKDIEYHNNYVSYKIVYDNKEYASSACVPSEFAIYNNLAALGICLLLGLDLRKVIELLSEPINIEGRYDVIKEGDSCTVIVDYAHTPAALENVLTAVHKNNSFQRIITVFGCGGDRDSSKRSVMGQISQTKSDITIITSDNPRTEAPMNIISDIKLGMNLDINNFYIIPDRKEAIEYAITLANKDDVVVIAGKGHEKEQIYNGYTIEFDDKKIASAALLKIH